MKKLLLLALLFSTVAQAQTPKGFRVNDDGRSAVIDSNVYKVYEDPTQQGRYIAADKYGGTGGGSISFGCSGDNRDSCTSWSGTPLHQWSHGCTSFIHGCEAYPEGPASICFGCACAGGSGDCHFTFGF